MKKLFIVIPAYNEADNIEQLVDDWYPVVNRINRESQLVIIDDGSKDDTYKILKKLKKSHPQLTCITKPNAGHGATVLYGYHYALEHDADSS